MSTLPRSVRRESLDAFCKTIEPHEAYPDLHYIGERGLVERAGDFIKDYIVRRLVPISSVFAVTYQGGDDDDGKREIIKATDCTIEDVIVGMPKGCYAFRIEEFRSTVIGDVVWRTIWPRRSLLFWPDGQIHTSEEVPHEDRLEPSQIIGCSNHQPHVLFVTSPHTQGRHYPYDPRLHQIV